MGKSVLSRLGWRWFVAVGLFSLAMIGQGLGVELSERMGETSGWLTRAYYSICLLYTSPSPRDLSTSRMPSSA